MPVRVEELAWDATVYKKITNKLFGSNLSGTVHEVKIQFYRSHSRSPRTGEFEIETHGEWEKEENKLQDW